MTTLKEQGYRYLVQPHLMQGDWIHPLEVSNYPDWVDCTDMDDDALLAFVIGLEANKQRIIKELEQ